LPAISAWWYIRSVVARAVHCGKPRSWAHVTQRMSSSPTGWRAIIPRVDPQPKQPKNEPDSSAHDMRRRSNRSWLGLNRAELTQQVVWDCGTPDSTSQISREETSARIFPIVIIGSRPHRNIQAVQGHSAACGRYRRNQVPAQGPWSHGVALDPGAAGGPGQPIRS
jgi:hypothetical protein